MNQDPSDPIATLLRAKGPEPSPFLVTRVMAHLRATTDPLPLAFPRGRITLSAALALLAGGLLVADAAELSATWLGMVLIAAGLGAGLVLGLEALRTRH